MSKLTPQQAFEHAKTLFPLAKYVRKVDHSVWVWFVEPISSHEFSYYIGGNVNWPPGVDRWPPPEPKYREPTMADVGKMVEVRDFASSQWTKPARLLHRGETNFVVLSEAGFGSNWTYARIKDEGAAS
jgi:hypothetical protein